MPPIAPGADPGFRRGGFVHQKGGGGVRTGISGADPSCCRVLGANQQAKKNCRQPWGGGGDHPKKKPVSAHEPLPPPGSAPAYMLSIVLDWSRTIVHTSGSKQPAFG